MHHFYLSNWKVSISRIVSIFVFTFISFGLFAQNTITIKTYQDDITATPQVVDGTEAVPTAGGSTSSIKAVVVNTATNQVVAIQEITSSPTTISSIPNGTYNVHIVENYTGSVGDAAPSGPQSFNDQRVTGVGVGSPIYATYPAYPIASNVSVTANTTVTFGFTSDSPNLGTVSGFIRDDNNVGIGGVNVQLIRVSDNSVAKEFITVNSVPNIADYGKYEFANVPTGEYYVQIAAPTGFNIIENSQSSDGDTTGETNTDEIIYVTLTASENDMNNNYTLQVPTNVDNCTHETTDVRFDWSGSAGSGNQWTKANHTDGETKTYILNYTDGLGNAQTLDVTVKMLDPAGINLDDSFTCPFSQGCDNQYEYYTTTNGVFGAGFLTLAQATQNTTDEVTFEFALSKPVYVKNFSVSDIDYASVNTNNDPNYLPKISFQDEVTITALNGTTPVALDYTVGSNLQLVDGNTVRSKEYILTASGGVNGDSSPSYPSNAVYVNSTDQVTKLIVKYRNGDEDATNINNDGGKSDGHFVRLNGFNLCAVNYAAIHGQVMEDTNSDNTGDTGVAGVTIVLKNPDGSLVTYADGSAIPTITTSDGTTDVNGDGKIDPAGSYYIPNINAGTYNVEITTPNGYTNVNDGDASPTDGGSSTPANTSTTDALVPVTVDAGQREMNNDFVIRTAPSPVTMGTFDSRRQDNDVLLSWNTLSEQNNDHFIVEYSYDGEYFEDVATVDGSGSSTSEEFYTYMHKGIGLVGQSSVYYRLSQMDYDGTRRAVSGINEVYFRSDGETYLYPNPVVRGDKLFLRGLSDVQSYTIYNSTGQILKTSKIISSNVGIDTDNLIPGLYFVSINSVKTLRFIVE